MINCMLPILIKERLGSDWIWTLSGRWISKESRVFSYRHWNWKLGRKDWPISTQHLHLWNRAEVGSFISDTLSWNGFVNLSLPSRLHLRELNYLARLNQSKEHLLLCYVVLCIKRNKALTNICNIVKTCQVVNIWSPFMCRKWFQSHSRWLVGITVHNNCPHKHL